MVNSGLITVPTKDSLRAGRGGADMKWATSAEENPAWLPSYRSPHQDSRVCALSITHVHAVAPVVPSAEPDDMATEAATDRRGAKARQAASIHGRIHRPRQGASPDPGRWRHYEHDPRPEGAANPGCRQRPPSQADRGQQCSSSLGGEATVLRVS